MQPQILFLGCTYYIIYLCVADGVALFPAVSASLARTRRARADDFSLAAASHTVCFRHSQQIAATYDVDKKDSFKVSVGH